MPNAEREKLFGKVNINFSPFVSNRYFTSRFIRMFIKQALNTKIVHNFEKLLIEIIFITQHFPSVWFSDPIPFKRGRLPTTSKPISAEANKLNKHVKAWPVFTNWHKFVNLPFFLSLNGSRFSKLIMLKAVAKNWQIGAIPTFLLSSKASHHLEIDWILLRGNHFGGKGQGIKNSNFLPRACALLDFTFVVLPLPFYFGEIPVSLRENCKWLAK